MQVAVRKKPSISKVCGGTLSMLVGSVGAPSKIIVSADTLRACLVFGTTSRMFYITVGRR